MLNDDFYTVKLFYGANALEFHYFVISLMLLVVLDAIQSAAA